jgi:uncharacterized damage-inducible protein DinB
VNTEINRIIQTLKETYAGNPWHGPSVKDVIGEISCDLSLVRLPHTHSIIEIISHMTAWRNFTIERLQKNDQYEITDEKNFPLLSNWATAVKGLDETQEKLIQVLQHIPDVKLNDNVPNRPYSFYTLLHGIIQHDIYHLGQLVLIKKHYFADVLI